MPPAAVADPLPLRPSQLRALVSVTARELVWGRSAVSQEIRHWRAQAARIPDPRLRANASEVLTRKRGNTDGAALFWTLARRRDRRLIRLLIAHEMIWDYLDEVSESAAGDDGGERNSRQLHRAIVESLDPARPISDYYRFHPWTDDGGYLRSLVCTCRQVVRGLPSYQLARGFTLRDAERSQVQSLNHLSDPTRRDRALQTWAARECADDDLMWFEHTAAASAPLAIHALLALAAEPRATARDIADAYGVYFWVSLTTVMLDSYADQFEDAARGAHSYFAHYASDDVAVERLTESIRRSARGALELRNGERHAVLVACMIALYLSKSSARVPELRATTHELALAGGSLTRLLLPILGLWRVQHGQRTA